MDSRRRRRRFSFSGGSRRVVPRVAPGRARGVSRAARGRRASRRRRGRCRGTTRGEDVRARDSVSARVQSGAVGGVSRTRRNPGATPGDPRGASPRLETGASARGRSTPRVSTRRRGSFPIQRARQTGVGAREGGVFFRRRRRDALARGGARRVRRRARRDKVATAPRDEREETSRRTSVRRVRARRVGVGSNRPEADERVDVDDDRAAFGAGTTSRRRIGDDSRAFGLALARSRGGVVARDSTGGGGTPRVGCVCGAVRRRREGGDGGGRLRRRRRERNRGRVQSLRGRSHLRPGLRVAQTVRAETRARTSSARPRFAFVPAEPRRGGAVRVLDGPRPGGIRGSGARASIPGRVPKTAVVLVLRGVDDPGRDGSRRVTTERAVGGGTRGVDRAVSRVFPARETDVRARADSRARGTLPQ